jgi:hypothetical protein
MADEIIRIHPGFSERASGARDWGIALSGSTLAVAGGSSSARSHRLSTPSARSEVACDKDRYSRRASQHQPRG